MGPASGPVVPYVQDKPTNPLTYEGLLLGSELAGTWPGEKIGELNADLINGPLMQAAGGSLLKAPSLLSKCPIKSFPTKTAAREALRQMGLPEEQLARALGAVSKATSESTIAVSQEGDNLVVSITRPGFNGYQEMQYTITAEGTKTVIQRAFDSAGNLVHYDPKTP
jgi:hypothetical protein